MMKWFVGVTSLMLVFSATVGLLRDKPFVDRLPVVVAAIASGAIFNGVEHGNDALGWFLVPILVLVTPFIPSLIRADRDPSSDSDDE